MEQLLDGLAPIPVEAFPRAFQELQEHEETVHWPVNVFLLRLEKQIVLIDTGFGDSGPASCGRLDQELRAIGLDRGDVTDIFLTHIHPDHVGGLVSSGQAAFPNATVFLSREEMEWLSRLRNSNPTAGIDLATLAVSTQALQPYTSARIETFIPGIDSLFGARTISLAGHSPGMAGLLFDTDAGVHIFCGDLFNDRHQLTSPELSTAFDWNARTANETRSKWLSAACQAGYLLAAAHQHEEGWLHVKQASSGFCLE